MLVEISLLGVTALLATEAIIPRAVYKEVAINGHGRPRLEKARIEGRNTLLFIHRTRQSIQNNLVAIMFNTTAKIYRKLLSRLNFTNATTRATAKAYMIGHIVIPD